MSPWQLNLTPSFVHSIATVGSACILERGSKVRTRLGQGAQVPADALELGRWHCDGGGVLGLGDAQVLLVNVHELDVVLADPVGAAVLEDEVDDIRRVLGLECEDVVALRGAEHLCERAQVDAEGDVAVAAERAEGLRPQQHRHERHVRVVHGLQRDARVIAVEVAVLDEVLDGVDDLWLLESVLCRRLVLVGACWYMPS